MVRQTRIGKLAAIGTLGAFGLFVGLVVWAVEGGVGGMALGAVAFLAVLLLLVIPMIISAAKEQKHEGPAGKGPSSFGQVVTTAPAAQVWEAVYAVLAAQKFTPPRAVDPQTVNSARSLSMASWGESITVRIEGTHDGRGVVTAWARPAFPLQWLDYGRNRRHANAVLNAVPGATPAV
ncbi:hypothetical protein N802_19125 [Knoellia sinensis KCTC 19936]|uniref:DUF1499 domain-containing protein n=2 Tax=Knoellia TaxID=136099 RepID=A0A0A0J3P4_9MICO|nr:hypothetical protein N802_19125 [Knoellia sinensis KCTC 19936]